MRRHAQLLWPQAQSQSGGLVVCVGDVGSVVCGGGSGAAPSSGHQVTDVTSLRHTHLVLVKDWVSRVHAGESAMLCGLRAEGSEAVRSPLRCP